MSPIAFQMAKKAKRMAQGGYVEPQPVEDLRPSHPEKKHFLEDEPSEKDLHGKGFSESDVPGDNRIYDIEPEKFAEGGEVHPLDAMFRDKFLNARKMAMGGTVESEKMRETYPTDLEDETQMDITDEGTSEPAYSPASEEPNEDEDRINFMRTYMTKKSMQGR